MQRLDQFLQRLERRPYHPAAFFLIVLLVGVGRTAEEVYLGHLRVPLNQLSNNSAFYMAVFFGFAGIAVILLRQGWERTANAVVFGVLLGLLPPLIDVIWLGPGEFYYRYLDRFYPTIHGAGNPYSEAIVAWLSLGVFALYLFVRSRSWWRAFVGLGLGYLYGVFVINLFPGYVAEILAPVQQLMIRGPYYSFLCLVFYVTANFWRFRQSIKRINHTLPWVVLVFLGASLFGGIQKTTWFMAAIVLLVHQGIVFVNDYYDRDSDRLNQRAGLVERNDVTVILVLTILMILCITFVMVKWGLLYFLYLLLATAYHHPALRLKKIFPLSYLLEGLGAAVALLIGMASADRVALDIPDLLYLGFAFAGFAIASPFKDYKDIPGDHATGTRTLYVLMGERGWPPEKTHRWISAVLLCLMAVPPFWLFSRGIPLLPALVPSVCLIPIFFSLRSSNKKSAVERTVWVLVAYLIALVLVLNFVKVPSDKGALKDYGGLYLGTKSYSPAHPASLEEVVEVVREANQDRTPIRIRGNAHSMNGMSLPRTHEVVIFTDRLRRYCFEETGSVTVGAGVRMYELASLLAEKGYGLPVINGGEGGPSVGGYLAGGGVGPGSDQYGGFWENVFEMTLVTGAGEVLQLKPGDELFSWMFGSMGQLGIIVSAKLKIVGGESAVYPSNEEGMIPPQEVTTSQRFYWFGVLAPTEEFGAVQAAMQKIKAAHPEAIRYRADHIYRMPFFHFNPKLIFPPQRDFIGVEIWGEPKSSDLEPLLALERDIADLVKTHRDVPYRRYIQVELVPPGTDYEAYFGTELYNEFLALKKRLDPNLLINCGMVFPCREELGRERRLPQPSSSGDSLQGGSPRRVVVPRSRSNSD